jgi:hypothetical protein
MMMFSTRLPSTATIASTKSGKTISKASKHDDLDVYRPVGRLFGNFYAAQRDTLQRHPGAGCFLLDYGDDESGLFMKYLRRGSGYYIDVGASELIQLGACPNSRCSILSESDSTLGDEQVFSPLEYRSDAASAAECG